MRSLSLLLLGFLAACASFSHGSMQSVLVKTPDVDGASCSLTDSKGRVSQVASTPGSAMVKRGNGPVSVICKKEGYTIGSGQITESLSAAVYGNILVPVGFLIDGVTGSAEDYASSVEIEMEPIVKAPNKLW